MNFSHLIKRRSEPKQSPFRPHSARFERARYAVADAWYAFQDRLPAPRNVSLRAPTVGFHAPLDRLHSSFGSFRGSHFARGRSDPGPGLDLGAILRRLEDAAWFLRKKVLWGLIDRYSGLKTRDRIATAGGAALAAGVVVAAIVIAATGGSGSTAPTASAPVAVVKPAPEPEIEVVAPRVTKPKAPPAPTLHGAAPVFVSPKAKAQAGTPKIAAKASGGKPSGAPAAPQPKAAAKPEKAIKPANAPAATAKIGATPAASATASRADAKPDTVGDAETTIGEKATVGGATELDGPPAGPKAIKVARDFAGAFVVYETGGVDSGVRKTFDSSAIPALSHSLLKRPPRLPANVKVPRAKVVNVVPGPSQGKVFTVSVSLLRVGVTSELRLEMEQRKHDGWQVTNVLG